jgi:uncharacterized protein YunC (DUF1805 family)
LFEVAVRAQYLSPTNEPRRPAVSDPLPRIISRPLQFANGCAIGVSNRWKRGQYCTILTEAGLVGCGIYDVKTAAEFGQAVAIARGTPQKPLVDPEDLFDAKIVDATPQAQALGVRVGMTGREAVELFLAATTHAHPARVRGEG